MEWIRLRIFEGRLTGRCVSYQEASPYFHARRNRCIWPVQQHLTCSIRSYYIEYHELPQYSFEYFQDHSCASAISALKKKGWHANAGSTNKIQKWNI